MKRLPLLLDDRPSPLVRAGIYLLIPFALLLLLPLLLLVILVFYLIAIFQGARIIVTVVTGKQQMPEHEFQEPHFLVTQIPAKVLPDESTLPPKG